MIEGLTPLAVFLSILWFFVYWVLGGVFFAAITILRLGRVHKVRFSCLFTLVAMACGIGASVFGLRYSQEAVTSCLLASENKTEAVAAIFGCGFVGVFSMFLLGAAVLTLAGFFIMTISKAKTKPWLVIDHSEEEEDVLEEMEGESKFF
jgi:hypothetical protein